MPNVHLLVLSLVISTMHGAVAHLLWGEGSKQLIIYWIAALAGFGVGQLLGTTFSWHDVVQIGELHLVAASAVCWLFIAFARRIRL